MLGMGGMVSGRLQCLSLGGLGGVGPRPGITGLLPNSIFSTIFVEHCPSHSHRVGPLHEDPIHNPRFFFFFFFFLSRFTELFTCSELTIVFISIELRNANIVMSQTWPIKCVCHQS